ncbi:MAG: ribonuclease PH [Candidatus Thermoplasmatota archaeon]|nr:ribonuclease PH [Candidatus Thermoplasmatota archaeon]
MEDESKILTARSDGRACGELRKISFETGIAPNATGSVLVSFGNTKVICAATAEKRVPPWMNALEPPKGWMSAEYSMLPYSTLQRKQRASSAGKVDGRSVEIQRLIGRSLRAVADLEKTPGWTLWIDCDVLQADGGTRTASISGAYVAAKIAVKKLMASGELAADPFVDSVAAVSVGMFGGRHVLDLPYEEDKDADVDANVVMTGSGRFVEIQASGEEATFDDSQLAELLGLARGGIAEISRLQSEAIESAK